MLGALIVTTTMLSSVAHATDTAAQVDRFMVAHDGARIETLAEGRSPLIVMLPSLGRSGDDYSQTAAKLAGDVAEEDPVAPRRFSKVLQSMIGDRVSVIVVPNASHALFPEQPDIVANEIAPFARRAFATPTP